jgi:hypothetical protein
LPGAWHCVPCSFEAPLDGAEGKTGLAAGASGPQVATDPRRQGQAPRSLQPVLMRRWMNMGASLANPTASSRLRSAGKRPPDKP